MPKPKVNKREDAVHWHSRCKYYADGIHYISITAFQQRGAVTCKGCCQFLWGITTIHEETDIWDLVEELWYGEKGA